VHDLIAEVEAGLIAADLNGEAEATPDSQAVHQLRVAASLALAEQIGQQTVEQILRAMTAPEGLVDGSHNTRAFEKWDAYLGALESTGSQPKLDDLVYYAASGLLARQQVEVRGTLRSFTKRNHLADFNQTSAGWVEYVRDQIGKALLLTVVQRDKDDLEASIAAIEGLAVQQRNLESQWLDRSAKPARDALALLGYYHLALAVSRTSEFLLSGSVDSGEGLSMDVGVELRRLLSRADEYFTFSSDAETRLWLNCVTVLLWVLRTDSLWVSGRGISDRLDKLLIELARGARERNVFSLLPSQQDAIRASLMDASRVAIILQMPTSSGKTLLAEFTILQTFDAFKESSRVVYLVPTRALATQAHRMLAEDLGPLGIDVIAAASAFEEDPFEVELLNSSNGVVVATPEKLDLLLRSHPEWFESLRLVVVDEAHCLSDSERGVRLELLLANVRRERPDARLLLMTPFVENADDIASWLGGARGLKISVQWRPVRLLLGLAKLTGVRKATRFVTEWKEPHRPHVVPRSIEIPAGVNKTALGSTRDKVACLARKFGSLGSVLALYSGSRTGPELLAVEAAESFSELALEDQPPGLRVAVALAEEEFGSNSRLAMCLKRGAAYHHSALSPTLRYLIEDQVRHGTVRFIAATTTLAQGMNFPVATVLVHSVHKPHGKGDLSVSEFWNIAGRAGRAGMVERGFVVFANEKHQKHWEEYGSGLNTSVKSALLKVLVLIGSTSASIGIKEQYRLHEELRPFIQYLAHAAATSSAEAALDQLEELLQGSLANAQVTTEVESRNLKNVARKYLSELTGRSAGLLKVGDRTGLGSFSFDELYAKIHDSETLMAGPKVLSENREKGMVELVEALRWLPELNLAIGKGEGDMDVAAVARVIQGWLDGRRIPELAAEFPGKSDEDRVRNASTYIFSTVSQTVAWGAHAYVRGWGMSQPTQSKWEKSEGAMLPAYIQHGVNTPEAAVLSLLNVPRQIAEPLAGIYRSAHGSLQPDEVGKLREFAETSSVDVWDAALAKSFLQVNAKDLRVVWRQMRGLPV
jgi:replicative superfamily II helicase